MLKKGDAMGYNYNTQHHFNVGLATMYGVTEAILLDRLWFWIEKNRTEERNFYDGRYWTFNSRKALEELFPYLSEKKIRTALNRLVDNGVLVVGRYNKLPFDRTLWYAFSDFGDQLMRGEIPFGEYDLAKGQMTFGEKANENLPKGQTNTIYYTVTTTDTDHNNISDGEKGKSPTPKKLGEEFESLWLLYPKKQGKDKAYGYYERARKSGTTYEEVEKGINAYNEYIKANETAMQYVKQGATFFSQKAWQDDWTIRNNTRTSQFSVEAEDILDGIL